ncbi:MAG: hypothetical protein HGA22_00575 [Clostridiales bacterium]|nr:hypothetical protein [Clostridiales bacterium]
MRSLFKNVLAVAILIVLVVFALGVLKVALAVVLPVAAVLLIAYVIYYLVTGQRV